MLKKDKSKEGVSLSLISKTTIIKGNISKCITIEIQGTVYGDVHSQNVIVGNQGNVEGNIFCNTISVTGTVKGNIKASNVNLFNGAFIEGNVQYEDIVIKRKAIVVGRLHINESKERIEKNIPENITLEEHANLRQNTSKHIH